MQVKPISAPPANLSSRETRFEVADVLREFQIGTPVVTAALTVLLSVEELTAALFTAAEYMTADEVAELSDQETRDAIAHAVTWDGMHAVQDNLTQIMTGDLLTDGRELADACAARIADLFGVALVAVTR
jgi:hypothetical protein